MSFDWVRNVNFYFLNEKGSRREFYFQRYKIIFTIKVTQENLIEKYWLIVPLINPILSPSNKQQQLYVNMALTENNSKGEWVLS